MWEILQNAGHLWKVLLQRNSWNFAGFPGFLQVSWSLAGLKKFGKAADKKEKKSLKSGKVTGLPSKFIKRPEYFEPEIVSRKPENQIFHAIKSDFGVQKFPLKWMVLPNKVLLNEALVSEVTTA